MTAPRFPPPGSTHCIHLCDVVRVSCPNLKLLHLNVENYPSVIESLGLLDLRVPMADSGYEPGSGAAGQTDATLTDIQCIKTGPYSGSSESDVRKLSCTMIDD